MSIGQRIKAARVAKGYTQSALASIIDTGTVYISELERGVRTPSVPMIIKLSDVLGVSTDYLLKGVVGTSMFDERLRSLSTEQYKTLMAILDAYISNL